MTKNKLIKIILPTAAALALGLAVGIWYLHNNSLIPRNIQKQINFAILVPSKTVSKVEKRTVKYSSTNKVLSFQSEYEGASLVISEQAFPDQFVDIPQAYDQFLNQLPTITSFGSVNGQVNIAEPPNLHGLTLIVMNTKGTFIFIHPSKNITENSWREFFNNLVVVK